MMYRSAFDEEIGTAPPSTVDIDGVIRRRRRMRYARTAVTAAAGVAAVAGLAGVTVTVLPDAGRPGERAGAPASSASASPGTSPGTSSDPEGDARSAEVAARLTTVLRGYLATAVPGAAYHANRSRLDPPVEPLVFTHQKKRGTSGQGGEDYYFASADVEDARGTGSVAVGVGWAGPESLDLTGTCPAEGPLDAASFTCAPQTGPRGDRIAVTEIRGSQAVKYRVEVVRPGGLAAFVEVTNQAGRTRTSEFDYDRRDAPLPPLSVTAATDLALLPDLSI